MATTHTNCMALRNTNTSNNRNIQQQIGGTYEKMLRNSLYKFLLFVSGLPVNLIVTLIYLVRKKSDPYLQIRKEIVNRYRQEGYENRLIEDARKQLTNKYLFFNKPISTIKLQKEAKRYADNVFQEEVRKS
ncbi:hypothetical protein HQN89_20430 [Paenibacillus frigoriresistens]|uniref:hypothetical protein n=1 Tax=Paenibacillus alginolyticus TaxID=59839 RepID=UPI0015670AE9|nr:hypothetical protein [Paenibacillus frigoriresistens]NRF93333.1 hypothetical protein [Paenibacillus frigoriresistens]